MDVVSTAKQLIADGQASCVILRQGQIVRTDSGPGVRPLLAIYDSDPALLKNAMILDKVVGKAVAMLAVLGGAEQVYGHRLSNSAWDYLTAHGCQVTYGERVDIILNRRGDGMCPLESSVLSIADPIAGLAAMRETIKQLMAGQN